MIRRSARRAWGLAARIARWAVAHRYGAVLAAYILAAAVTGAACVGFMRLFEFALDRRLDAARVGAWRWLTTPALFMASVWLIRRVAPAAAGTGIPQAIFAARHMHDRAGAGVRSLLGPRTVAVKVLALLLAVAAGASTGREGPTVHVAAGVFLAVLWAVSRVTGIAVERRSAVVAGGAAGLAAAFNTPLAGVTFAIEELARGGFGAFKDYVLMAIVVAALAAKALTGDYTYFGRLADPAALPLATIVWIGLAGGLAGAAFSTAIVAGVRAGARLRLRGALAVAAALSVTLLALARTSPVDVTGPGNLVASDLLHGAGGDWVAAFPLFKIAATLLTYWSGVAGGIFAPCLSTGAALGAAVAGWADQATATGALVGMAAFLSGTIQAPITAFVIIFEMTGHHAMLLPVMLGALLAFMAARLSGAAHLYGTLAESYTGLLAPAARRAV